MNSLYLAKRQLNIAGLLDMVCMMFWVPLIFIVSVYHFSYLIPNSYPNFSDTESTDVASSSSTISSAYGKVISGGYSSLFGLELVDFLLFKLSVWTIVLFLFIGALFCFISKMFFGFLALISFFKNKSIHHIYAALAVLFFPMIGGIIAINTYKATTSRLSPKYISSYSFIRFKVRSWWNNISRSDTFKPEINPLDNVE